MQAGKSTKEQGLDDATRAESGAFPICKENDFHLTYSLLFSEARTDWIGESVQE